MNNVSLCPFQFGTHDVVVLKPNKADLGSPPLGQGVVYRLKVIVRLWLVALIMVNIIFMKNVIIFYLFCHLISRWLIKQDTSITIAFDDIPEDGLNSPLRLEKLANEVNFAVFHFVKKCLFT